MLGQSLSRGWTATVDGKDLGRPTLVDGYANGWRITPTSSAFTVELRWTPQRLVWIALVVSAVSVLASLVLLAVTRRRRPGRRGAGTDAVPPATPDLPTWEPLRRRGSGGGTSSDDGERSAGRRKQRPRLPLRTTALVSLAAGLVALVVAGPVAGLVAVVAAAIGLTTSWGRLPLRLGPPACLAASVLYVLEVQARYDLPTTGSWVESFSKVTIVSWLAVLLLATDMVVVAAVRRWGQGEPADGNGGEGEGGGGATTLTAAAVPPAPAPPAAPTAAPSQAPRAAAPAAPTGRRHPDAARAGAPRAVLDAQLAAIGRAISITASSVSDPVAEPLGLQRLE